MVPITMVLALTAGLLVPHVVDWMGVENGPFEGATQDKAPWGKRPRLSLSLMIYWIGLLGLFPLLAGMACGGLARVLHTRSRRAAWIMAVVTGGTAAIGCLVGDSSSEITGWRLSSAVVSAVAGAIGFTSTLGWGDRALYDHVGRKWFGHRVRFGSRYTIFSSTDELTASQLATLKSIPPDQHIRVGEDWIELYRYPAAHPNPSSELVSAFRCWKIRKPWWWWCVAGLRSVPVRRTKCVMPPTFVDRAVYEMRLAD